MRCRSVISLVACAAFGYGTGAAAKEYAPGESIEPASSEGLLAIDIESLGGATSAKIDRVGALFGGTTLTNLHAGGNVRLIALPPGEYVWSRITFSGMGLYLTVRDDPRFHFKVEAGLVNYGGDFTIAPAGNGLSYNLTTDDHAARMLVHLDRQFPGVVQKFSLRYQGQFPDHFPEFVRAELDGQSTLPALETASTQALKDVPTEVAPELKPLVQELFARSQVQVVRLNPRGDLVAMIEYRGGKSHVSLLDVASQQAIDVYRGTVAVRKIHFAGDRTLLYELASSGGDNNTIVHVDSKPGAAPRFEQFDVPGRGWFIDAGNDGGAHATFAHVEVEGDVHLFRISLQGRRFDTSQFRSELRLDKGLENVFSGLTDASGTLRVALTRADGGYAMMYRTDLKSPWREIRRHTADEVFEPVALAVDGASLIALSNKDRAQTDVVRMSLPSGDIMETLFSNPGSDVEGVLVRPSDRQVFGVLAYYDGQLDTRYIGERDDKLQHAISRALPGKTVSIYDASADLSRILALAYDEMERGTFYLFEPGANKLRELLSVSPPTPHVRAQRSRVLKATSADGTALEAYLTEPYQAKAPYPLIVMPHGGPIGVRDSIEFDPEVQLLANRGYAVLRVNYRGSSGFGRAFQEAGFGAWGKSIEDDILAAIDTALTAAPIDRDRIALRGVSYGGYSALMGLIRTPERFRCGIAASAVSDVPLLFTSSDWSQDKNIRERMMHMVGDPTKGLDAMESISPDYLYRKLNRPLLIVHGAMDKRVPMEHALRLMLLLGHANRPPQSVFLAHEGHGIADLDARYLAEAAIDRFLAACLAPEHTTAERPSVAH